MLLSVSLLNSKSKTADVLKLNNTNINYYHIDVMDGKFVSQKSFPFKEIKEVSKISQKPLDIHLMTKKPQSYIRKIKRLTNVNNITVHLETEDNIKDVLKKIKDQGIKCGIAIKPTTNINLLKPYLDIIDIILIMTVEPGLGGQPFIEESIERINKIKEYFSRSRWRNKQ